MFGFDKPPLTRFVDMVGGYLRFDFGRSFFRDQSVLKLILQKMPVSISLGLWSTLLVYLVSIPLGIAKAVRDGSRFDVASSAVVLVGYAVPSFLFAILLVVLFGIGTDYFLFLMFRYRERLRLGDDKKEAMVQSVTRIGEVIASAACVSSPPSWR